MSEQELKPCPFCGFQAAIEAGQKDAETGEPYAFFIRCGGCDCYFEAPSKNIYDWDRFMRYGTREQQGEEE